jgi:hypothetical protein
VLLGVTVSVERSHYNYREGQDPRGLLPICANLTGEIERDLSIDVRFRAGTATREFIQSRLVVFHMYRQNSLPSAIFSFSLATCPKWYLACISAHQRAAPILG